MEPGGRGVRGRWVRTGQRGAHGERGPSGCCTFEAGCFSRSNAAVACCKTCNLYVTTILIH